jgi:hypothetical protein
VGKTFKDQRDWERKKAKGFKKETEVDEFRKIARSYKLRATQGFDDIDDFDDDLPEVPSTS